MTQACLFCAADCSCPTTKQKKKRAASLSTEAVRRERRAAVAQFVAEIEGRLYRAETDAVFSLEDWERIRFVLLGSKAERPDERGIVRVPEDAWEELCDLLLVAEREKILAEQEGRIPPSDTRGPDRYLCRRKFPAKEFHRLLKMVLPEMFSPPEPAEPTDLDPGSKFQRSLKVFAMGERWDRGEALHHPGDLSVRGKGEALPDWLAYLAETDEVVDQTYARRMAAEEAAPRPKLSLVGCMDAPEYEFNFMDSLKQKPEECERAARTCRAHAE